MGSIYHQDELITLIQGDALELTQHIEPESVDLIITSPPYFALRSYKDGDEHYAGQIGDEPTPQLFLEALWAVTAQCQQVLKPTGSMFVNLGDKYQHKSLMGLPWRYVFGCVDGAAGDPWVLRSEIVWSKPNGLPESVTDRVRRSHETWFHLTRQPKYFASLDEIREPYSLSSLNRYSYKFGNGPAAAVATSPSVGDGTGHTTEQNPLGKMPGSVWTIPTESLRVPDWLGVDHFAAFPQEWPRRIIQGWSPTGGVVLDPFNGTGTVAMVARILGRKAIGVDLSRDYLKLAMWRIYESGHATKSLERTMREAQIELF